jgi:Ca-activated chloride channel family protein
VRSGTPTRLNVNLEAGVLGLKTAGGKAIEIVAAERDINNERESIHISYEPDLNLALNAGDYVAIVEFSDDRKVERPFSVAAGKRVEVEVKP